MCRLLWSGFQSTGDYCFHLRIRDLSRRAWARFVDQSLQAGSAKSASPFADRLVGDPQLPGDLAAFQALCSAQYDARPQGQSLSSFRTARPFLQLASFLLGQHDRFGWSPHAGWTPSIARGKDIIYTDF